MRTFVGILARTGKLIQGMKDTFSASSGPTITCCKQPYDVPEEICPIAIFEVPFASVFQNR